MYFSLLNYGRIGENMSDDDQQLATHLAIAKDLLQENSTRWNDFFLILKRKGLVQCYERRIRVYCSSSSIEDFCQHIQEYLLLRNNYALIILIATNQGFTSGYFRKVLQGIYDDFFDKYAETWAKENKKEAEKRKREKQKDQLLSKEEKEYKTEWDGIQDSTFYSKIYIDDNDDDKNRHEIIAAPKEDFENEEYSKKNLKLDKSVYNDPNILYFAQHPIKVWKRNQKDFLMLWMVYVLKYNHDYTAKVLALSTENNVSTRIKRFREGVFSYSADGTSASQILDDWLKHSFILQFTPKSQESYLILHMPLNCSEPSKCYIRVELVKENGAYISEANVKFGNVRFKIQNGWSEMTLANFHSAIKIKSGCVKVSDCSNGQELEFFPVYQNTNIVKTITDDVFDEWRTEKSNTLKFLADFGVGFAWLLNREMNYERYGAPMKFNYADLSVVSGEALILFATNAKCENGVLPKHGFVLPLEWRYLRESVEPYSPLLPQALIDLGKKIAAQQKVPYGWGLHPSFRFFHDQVDFSRQTVFGATDEVVASAYLSLSTALTLAVQGYTTPTQIFASAQYNWQHESLQQINLLESKLKVASDWAANSFFVAREQQIEAEKIISANNFSFNAVGCGSGKNVAFHFLSPLLPKNLSPLHSNKLRYKFSRKKLIEVLSTLGNVGWDKKVGRNSFVILSGNPGVGKSILMSDLRERYLGKHTVFSFACNAGDKECAENFVKSIAYQMACKSLAFANIALDNLSKLINAGIEEQYRKLLFEPLLETADKNKSHRYYILIDGLDEDMSGTIYQLLTNQSMQFPKNYAVIVSTRPMEPMFSRLKSVATDILDLESEKFNKFCSNDLNTFIINYIYSDENVKKSWYDAGYNDEELRRKISCKDKSFLYARYVLQGVADGMYHFDSLEHELPAGLISFYEQSFNYRFATALEYDAVRPLLKLLLEHESVTIKEASACLQLPVGKLVKLLQGYCVVTDDTLSLSDATLRDWLCDSIKNPDFSIF